VGADAPEFAVKKSRTTGMQPPTDLLFVYGTLLTGESRHHMLAAGRVVSILAATVAGLLLDFNEYPELVRPTQESARVLGELVKFESLDSILDALDAEEGPDFRRELIEAALADGSICLAWVYVFTGKQRSARALSSGSWRDR
jgi:gamma-glutamylcyclotransferase (GGCT)/AIG2-like uncharacterized protein YtfP